MRGKHCQNNCFPWKRDIPFESGNWEYLLLLMIGLASESLWTPLTKIQISANQGLLWLVMQKNLEKKSRGADLIFTNRNIEES